jgi:hypothetical protein
MLKSDKERKAWGMWFLLGMALLLSFNAKDYVFQL